MSSLDDMSSLSIQEALSSGGSKISEIIPGGEGDKRGAGGEAALFETPTALFALSRLTFFFPFRRSNRWSRLGTVRTSHALLVGGSELVW
jgi:hypothetical protein